MTIILKRVYDPQTDTDGFRVLADRLWPRGIKKEALALDLWAKEIAPSTALRERYHQDGDFKAFKKSRSVLSYKKRFPHGRKPCPMRKRRILRDLFARRRKIGFGKRIVFLVFRAFECVVFSEKVRFYSTCIQSDFPVKVRSCRKSCRT